MIIVQHGVLDSRIDNAAGQRGFPDAFGSPHSRWSRAELSLQKGTVGLDLSHAIDRWQHRHDRFVVRAANDFDSACVNQHPNTIQVFRVPLGQPMHQWAGSMQRNLQLFVGLKDFQEWQIAVLVGLLKDAVEVADRLVVVKDQAQVRRSSHGSESTSVETKWAK